MHIQINFRLTALDIITNYLRAHELQGAAHRDVDPVGVEAQLLSQAEVDDLEPVLHVAGLRHARTVGGTPEKKSGKNIFEKKYIG